MIINKYLIPILSLFVIAGCEQAFKIEQAAIKVIAPYQYQGLPFDNFGDANGSLIYDINLDGSVKDYARSVAIQPDGKFLVAGETLSANPSGPMDAYIARFNTDGTLDTSFNSTGIAIYNSSYDRRDIIYSISVMNNKIYAFGASRTTHLADSWRGMILRYNLDGTLDSTWGTNGQRFYYDAGSYAAYFLKAKVLANGKIFVFGSVIVTPGVREYIITKMNADGSFDTSFGTNGEFRYGGGMAYLSLDGGIDVDNQERPIVGFLLGPANTDFQTKILRLTPSGILDSSFATNGVFTLNYELRNYTRSVIFHNNEIIVSGLTNTTTADAAQFAAYHLKLDSNGVLVPGFGANGIASFRINPANHLFGFSDSKIDGNHIFSVGHRDNRFIVASVNISTGELDDKFGVNGIHSTLTVGSKPNLLEMAIDKNSKAIWAAGNTDIDLANQQIHIAKFK